MRLFRSAALAVLASPLASQTFIDGFNYPNGPVVPGWTQQRGAWQVINGHIGITSDALWSYITKDGLSPKNCVLDGEFFYVGAGVHFGGLTSRHPGGNIDNNLLMVKIRDNGATSHDAGGKSARNGRAARSLRTPREARRLSAPFRSGVVSRRAEAVSARWIAEVLPQVGKHGLEDRGIERRRGVVIEIDRIHAPVFRTGTGMDVGLLPGPAESGKSESQAL